ncbi:unnamed protein product [Didymodactylos carnosus]|uniref:Protein kinase domain-containing protein n=1 Tax=Didymodactylos carnosus TaxID=1234261 RepID=A0A8S2QI83_9BILA|nr:unnamed protein product [Didymodactylos carnosus]CAF4112754.1 unnamed protein product [Didymodactylos carnosus]
MTDSNDKELEKIRLLLQLEDKKVQLEDKKVQLEDKKVQQLQLQLQIEEKKLERARLHPPSSSASLSATSYADYYRFSILPYLTTCDFQYPIVKDIDKLYGDKKFKRRLIGFLRNVTESKPELEVQYDFQTLLIRNELCNTPDSLFSFFDTHSIYYLNRKAVDISFFFNGTNLNRSSFDDAYLELVVLVCEFKAPDVNIGVEGDLGQMFKYLNVILSEQYRTHVYGLVCNGDSIVYTKAEKYFREPKYYKTNKISLRRPDKSVDDEAVKQLICLLKGYDDVEKNMSFYGTSFYYNRQSLLPRHLIERRLGRGLTSRTFLLSDNNDTRCKSVLKLRYGQDFKSVFQNEVNLVLRLHSSSSSKFFESCLLKIIEYDKIDYRFICFDKQLIEIKEQLTYKQILSLFQIVIELNKQRIVHRDIRPNNILLCIQTKDLYLVDFGFACEMGSYVSFAGTVCYAPAHMLLNLRHRFGHYGSLFQYNDENYDLESFVKVLVFYDNVENREKLQKLDTISRQDDKIEAYISFWDKIRSNEKFQKLFDLVQLAAHHLTMYEQNIANELNTLFNNGQSASSSNVQTAGKILKN